MNVLLVLFVVEFWLVLAAIWMVARQEGKMTTDVSALQAELNALQAKVGILETLIPGLSQDYQSLVARIEALEAALAASDPVATQAAIDALKQQAAAINLRLEQANSQLGVLDASVPPPPAPPGT